jgi:alpha-galactosidase/6-phospho-beta-glucosidase family protein
MEIAAKLDEWGRGAWIAVTIAAFVVFWPAGLALLVYLIWSGRMGCRHYYWDESMKDEFRQRREALREEWRTRRQEWRDMKHDWKNEMRDHWRTHQRAAESSGNAAFDEYKAETLKRLEEEQAEFSDFLANLRKARDKAEFDQFMQSRRSAKTEPAAEPAPEPTPEPNSDQDNQDNY